MSRVEVHIPEIGTDEKVDVVEVLVAAGERVEAEAGLVTLESDKASMDVPSPQAGVVEKITVKVGDKVGEGDLIAVLEVAKGEEDRESAGGDEAGGEGRAGEPGGESEERGAEPEDEDAGQADAERGAGPAGGPAGAGRAAGARSVDGTGEAAGGTGEGATDAARAEADLHAEVLVLGSGPGGYTAAFRAADLGKRVVLVERHATLGGVCLNVGCIPSKALLHVARVVEEAADLGEHGVRFGEPELDLDRLRAWKDEVVGRLTSGLARMARQREVEVVVGSGRFTGEHTLEVTDGDDRRTVSFDSAIIAAGSRVVELPGIPHEDARVMDSTAALELQGIPERLLIVGGGIIGLEMATVYAALGSRITVVELLDGLIPGCDRDLVRPLERRLEKRYGAKIRIGTKVARVEAGEEALTVFFESAGGSGGGNGDPDGDGDSTDTAGAADPAEFDRVLVAAGRRPNADRIGLEATGVETDDRGFIRVDAQRRTNVPHIFAIGDLVPGPMLAHKASHEGKVAAEAAAGERSAFDARVVPSVAYTDPEIAWVGLTETAAKESGTAYEKGSFPWAASGRSLGMGRSDGMTKILFDPETKRVVGAGIVGVGAGDLIAELALAIEMDCEAADLALTVHPHPTLSETIAFAAEAFEGTITDLYLKK